MTGPPWLPALPETAARPTAAGWGGPARQGDARDLIQLVRETVAASVPRQALHLRAAGLAPRLSRGHHHRLVRAVLIYLLKQNAL